jgi:hypothetical protein
VFPGTGQTLDGREVAGDAPAPATAAAADPGAFPGAGQVLGAGASTTNATGRSAGAAAGTGVPSPGAAKAGPAAGGLLAPRGAGRGYDYPATIHDSLANEAAADPGGVAGPPPAANRVVPEGRPAGGQSVAGAAPAVRPRSGQDSVGPGAASPGGAVAPRGTAANPATIHDSPAAEGDPAAARDSPAVPGGLALRGRSSGGQTMVVHPSARQDSVPGPEATPDHAGTHPDATVPDAAASPGAAAIRSPLADGDPAAADGVPAVPGRLVVQGMFPGAQVTAGAARTASSGIPVTPSAEAGQGSGPGPAAVPPQAVGLVTPVAAVAPAGLVTPADPQDPGPQDLPAPAPSPGRPQPFPAPDPEPLPSAAPPPARAAAPGEGRAGRPPPPGPAGPGGAARVRLDGNEDLVRKVLGNLARLGSPEDPSPDGIRRLHAQLISDEDHRAAMGHGNAAQANYLAQHLAGRGQRPGLPGGVRAQVPSGTGGPGTSQAVTTTEPPAAGSQGQATGGAPAVQGAAARDQPPPASNLQPAAEAAGARAAGSSSPVRPATPPGRTEVQDHAGPAAKGSRSGDSGSQPAASARLHATSLSTPAPGPAGPAQEPQAGGRRLFSVTRPGLASAAGETVPVGHPQANAPPSPGPPGGGVPAHSLPALPDGTFEARLAMDDGDAVGGRRPRAETGRAILPGDRPAGNPEVDSWYDTSGGMVQARRGAAVIELSHGDGGEVNGIILAPHRRYNPLRAGPLLVSGVPAGLYAVLARIGPGEGGRGAAFTLPHFDGSQDRRPLGELPELLERHGWTNGQAIVIRGDFTRDLDGVDAARRWEALAGEAAGLAQAAGASVFFPGRGSATALLGGELAVDGGDDPRWWRADPPRGPGEPARPALVQDLAGRLREPGTRIVSLRMDARAGLAAGVASPADEMMRRRARDYRLAPGDDGRPVFVVDVPLTRDGGIGLAREDPGAGPGRPAGRAGPVELMPTRVEPAGTAEVVGMIRNAGYQPDEQVIQFLAAPPDDRAHAVFRAQAQEVANQIGRDVYIVSTAGATVEYNNSRRLFAVRRAGWRATWRDAGWQRLNPSAAGGQAGQEQPPAYFGTDQHGILAPAGPAQEPATQPDPVGPDGTGGGLPGSAEGSGREQRQAVPAEAGARVGGQPPAPPPLTQSPEGYADLLHGADPASLTVGQEFSINREAFAFVSNRFSGTGHFVIAWPVGRALPRPADGIMFGRGTSFVVTDISGEEGRRVIRLRHPGQEASPPPGSTHGEIPSVSPASLPSSQRPSPPPPPPPPAGPSDGPPGGSADSSGPGATRLPSFSGDSERGQRSPAVLAEARAQVGGQTGERSPGWYSMVAAGLASLPQARIAAGYAAGLPGADPASLTVGQEFSVTRPALAYAADEFVPGGDHMLVIPRPYARDLSGLGTDTSSMIMFASHTAFVVTSIDDWSGRRVIRLGQQAEAAPPSPATPRHPGPGRGPRPRSRPLPPPPPQAQAGRRSSLAAGAAWPAT